MHAETFTCGLCFVLYFLLMQDKAWFVTATEPVVHTTHGKIRGFEEQTGIVKIHTYLGVPYAKPPVGPLRFRRPEAMPPWHGTRDTTKLAPDCMQRKDVVFPGFLFKLSNPNTPMSEDCLYLNIWAPEKNSSRPKAVMVWIHGGGFYAGTSTVDGYNGKKLASQNVIVASMNYRLSPIGLFYNGNEDGPGNLALLDQQLALRWVKDNIATFGGDPDRITIFGESAGSACVSYHLLSESSHGLFNNAVLQSGSATNNQWAYMDPTAAKELSREFSQSVGCRDENDLNCLQLLDASTLSESKVWLRPTTDGYFLKEEPAKSLKIGRVKRTSVIIGFNENEGTFSTAFLYRNLLKAWEYNGTITKKQFSNALQSVVYRMMGKSKEIYTRALEFQYSIHNWSKNLSYFDTLTEICGDFFMNCGIIKFAKGYMEAGGRVYMYKLSHRPVNTPIPTWMGVNHGLDLYYLFNNNEFQFTREEQQLSQHMMSYWTNLAKYGEPNKGSSLPSWPLYTKSNGFYLRLDVNDELTQADNLREKECEFWNTYMPQLQSEIEKCIEVTSGTDSARYAPRSISWLWLIAVAVRTMK